MTLFGCLWLSIIIVAFLNKDIKPMIFVTCIGMIWQSTDVIDINNFSCGPQLITSLFFIAKTLINSPKIVFKKGIKNFICSFIPLMGYILINCYINEKNNFIDVTIIYIYIITFYCLKKYSKNITQKYFEKIIIWITLILLLIGAFQIIINLYNLPKENIIKILFFNDASGGDTYYYSNSTRFYSTFMEPSYVAGLIVGLFMYFFLRKHNGYKHYLIMFLLLLAILLTFSSTAYGTLAIVLVLYTLKYIKKAKTWKYLILAICIILLIGMFTNILDEVIFKKGETGSARTRNRLNSYAQSVFLEKPLIGSGYGTVRASSLFYTLLAEIGIIGFGLYLIPIINICKDVLKIKQNFQLESMVFMVLSMTIAQMIACPDLDLCSFWLAMYLYAIVPKIDMKNKEIEYEKNWNINVS